MKKIILAVLIVALVVTGILSISIPKNWIGELDMSGCRQPGSYFLEGEERYVLVDQAKQNIGGEEYLCKVFADKYMLTMYLWVGKSVGPLSTGSLTQILYEDGSPMIYDDVTLLEEETQK